MYGYEELSDKYFLVSWKLELDHRLTMLMNLLDVAIRKYEEGEPKLSRFHINKARRLKIRGLKHVKELSSDKNTKVNEFLIMTLDDFLFVETKNSIRR
jgi:hypothetical protein